MKIRSAIERLSRNRVLRKRLPSEFGGSRIFVTPDAALRYWRPGRAAFDRMLLRAATHRVQHSMTVWDVGANVGVFALAAASRHGPSGTTLAIEPDPFLASLIQRSTMQRSADSGQATVICAALGNRNGLASFTIAARGRASNSLVEASGRSQTGGTRHVSVVPILTPAVLLEHAGPPDFIKIDVEGAEIDILKASADLLHAHHPDLLVEVGEADRDQATDLLRGHGYTLHDASEGFLGKNPITNCVFNTFATFS